MGIFDSVGEKLGKVDSFVSKVNHYEKKVTQLINDPIGTLTGSSKLGVFSSGEIAKLIARPDPLLSFNWEVMMPTITTTQQYTLGSEYVESCSIALPNFGNRQVRQFGRYVSYPEVTIQYDSVTIQFYGDVQNTAFTYLKAWNTLVHPLDGVFGTPNSPKDYPGMSGYKQDIVLITKDAYNATVFSITYKGAWPINIQSSTDFNSNNERISFIATFSIDDVIVSGYNIDTITNTIKTSITGTIKGVVGSVVDSVKDIGKNAIKSITKPITDRVNNAIKSVGNMFGGEENGSGGESGGGSQ